MEQRFLSEDGSLADGSLLNRALDRFYRRIQSTNRLLPQSAKEYDKLALQIVFNVSRKQTKLSADAIKKRFDVRFNYFKSYFLRRSTLILQVMCR